MTDNFNEQMVGLLTKQTEILNELKEGMHTKTPATSQTANKLHGANGLFSSGALERDIISAVVRPKGVASMIPAIPGVNEDPRFGSITGFTAVTGSQPTAVCADAPTAYMKGCNLTAMFGTTRFDTNTIDIEKTMLRLNRGDPQDLVLRGRLLGMDNLGPAGMDENKVLNILTESEMVTAAVSAERKISQDIWQGTVAGGTFPGLDVQVATGQKDADSAVLCPALDSDVKDFNYDLVDGSSRDIVEYLSMLEFYLRNNAVTMGLDPVEWVIAMRPELWFELSAVWPCRYQSNRCSNASGGVVNVINDNGNIAMRDAMRNGMYIDINGNRYPVATDTGIYERTNVNDANVARGFYASSIYMLPLTIQGNFPVLYREYLDYSKASRETPSLRGLPTFWTDSGMYSWAIESHNWCFKLALRTEQRIVLRTPQLAGKIQKVKYSPLQHLREPYPESPYFADGGVSTRGYSWGQAAWVGALR
jgi:hypothetical protein